MKILLTGVTGYIGKRLLPVLVQQGHNVVCCVRDLDRFNPPVSLLDKIEIIKVDLLDKLSLNLIPNDIDGAFYLVHSMSGSLNFEELELECANNFKNALIQTSVQHVIYLSGIVNEDTLSTHLLSRRNVEEELRKGNYNFTTLRASIIIGSGSASFEIIRDLVEKLPIIIAPRWLKTKSQPIGVSDVILFLTGTLFNSETYNRSFDIGGADILSYKEMLAGYAEIRDLKRWIYSVPLMTAKLSSYWLFFITSTSYKLAKALVDSMKVEVVCRSNDLNIILDISPISYRESLRKAFLKIQSNSVISSWKDSMVSGRLNINVSDFLNVPTFGCYCDKRSKPINDIDTCVERIWRIGGSNGWYHGDWLWQIRGFIDKLSGGVGLRRGRTNDIDLLAGDSVDFWRVLYANREEKRLLLLAEMKLPGEAWLEFRIKDGILFQTATYRPRGVLGRFYWFVVSIFHGYIFNGLIKKLVK